MNQPVASRKVRLSPLGWWGFGGILAALAASQIATFYQDATELSPVHDHGFAALVAAGVAGLSFIIGITQSRGGWVERVMAGVLFGGVGAAAAALLTSSLATYWDMKTDFPAGKTRTFAAAVEVGSANQVLGRYSHWNVETPRPTPRVRLPITRADYDFMAANRSPADLGKARDHVLSDGYFCMHVTVQTSGDALRVMHAGTLPAGTVSVCAQETVRTLMQTSAPPNGTVIRLHAQVAGGPGGMVVRDERCADVCADVLPLDVIDDSGSDGLNPAVRKVQDVLGCCGARRAYFDMVVRAEVVPHGSADARVTRVRLIKVEGASADTPEHWLAAHKAG